MPTRGKGKWTAKDERQYKHIVKSCSAGRKKRSLKTCKRIAAATVNRDRAVKTAGCGCG